MSEMLALYLRLIVYPVSIFGVLLVMMLRADWKKNPASLVNIGQAILLAAQFSVVVSRLLGGPGVVTVVSDHVITPALILFTVLVYLSLLLSPIRWRRQPHRYIRAKGTAPI